MSREDRARKARSKFHLSHQSMKYSSTRNTSPMHVAGNKACERSDRASRRSAPASATLANSPGALRCWRENGTSPAVAQSINLKHQERQLTFPPKLDERNFSVHLHRQAAPALAR